METQTYTPGARSWLFVSDDSKRKMEKAIARNADIVIFDLEDAVADAEKSTARGCDVAFNEAAFIIRQRGFR